MSLLDSITRSIQNIFVGSHKGEDINIDAFEEKPLPKNTKVVSTPQPPPGFVATEKVNEPGSNDLGFNPNAWFDSPNKYAPAERRAELESEINPRPEEDVAEWFMEKPDESDEIEQEKTMHQKMYEMATAKYNPFAIGGSESLGGGSEKINGTE